MRFQLPFKLVAVAAICAAGVLTLQASADPLQDRAKEAGRRVATQTSDAARASPTDEATVQQVTGGSIYATGSINSTNGFRGSVTSSLKLSCGSGDSVTSRTGTRVATAYCGGNAAVISLCRSAIEEGRPCEDADWFDTPTISSGATYTDADFTIEVAQCAGTATGGTCQIKLTEQEEQSSAPSDLTALGNARATSASANSVFGRNLQLAHGAQTVTTPTQSFTYRSKTEQGGQWVNQNERISSNYASTGNLISDPSACHNGVCGQNHGPFNTSLYLSNCTTECTGTTTTTTTSTRQCTLPIDQYSRFCTQPLHSQTCTIRRQYRESTCTIDEDGTGNEDCPEASNSMCWVTRRVTTQSPPGCVLARENGPTFAMNGAGGLMKVGYKAGLQIAAAAPGRCQLITTIYYRCDTGEEPVVSCQDGTNGSSCQSGTLTCTTEDSRARNDPTMGKCLAGNITKSCPSGEANCLGDAPSSSDPSCSAPTTACIYDSTDPTAGCPASVADGSDTGEPSGDPYCTCQGIGQTCSPPAGSGSEENTCGQYEENPRCSYQSEITAYDSDGTPSSITRYYSCQEEQTVCTASSQVCSDTEEAAPPYSGFEQVAAASTVVDQFAEGVGAAGVDGTSIKLFSGTAADCKKPLDTGGTVTKNCCRDGLTKEQNRLLNTCNSEDVDIASAKRTNRAVSFGNYCSRKINLGFTRVCVERTSTFCLFPSVIAKLIQEQGRQQLGGAMQSSSGNPWNTTSTFRYYGTGATGQWVTLGSHYDTTLAAWQWPSNCSDSEYALGANTARSCPSSGQVFIAACRAGRCPTMTSDPRYGPPPQTEWRISEFAREQNLTLAISDNAQASGSCPLFKKDANGNNLLDASGNKIPNNDCKYTVGVTQRLVSGRANLSSEVSWPAYAGSPGFDTSKAATGRYYFQGYVFGEGAQTSGTPSTVQMLITYSPNGLRQDGTFASGATSATVNLNTNQPGKSDFQALGTSFTYSGGCRRDIQHCIYQFTVLVPISGKPWCGDNCRKANLDCSGFTPEEFASLDMSKIDLSEVASELSRPTTNPDFSSQQATVIGQTSSIENDFITGNGTSQAGNQQVLRVYPDNGDPEWTTTLTATGEYPVDGSGRITVNSVSIDWGDGTSHTQLQHANSGTAFKATHTYAETINGVDSKNRVFFIAVNFTLSNGQTKTVPARVQSWRDTPPSNPTRNGGGSGSADQYDPRTSPSGGNIGSMPAKPAPTGP